MYSDFFDLTEDEFNLIDQLPMCGCGKPQLAYEVYRSLLAVCPAPGQDDWPNWDDRLAAADGNETLFYVASYVLDSIEATEHGGSVEGDWLTEKGVRLLDILNRYAERGYEGIPAFPVDA